MPTTTCSTSWPASSSRRSAARAGSASCARTSSSPPACARRPRTASSAAARRNRAWPHARRDGPMHGMGTQKALDDSGQAEFDPELGQNAAPAGGVAASANDMGRWIAIQLARGALPEGSGRLFSEAASRQMWTPRVHLPISPSPGPTAAATPQFNGYALGWTERDYRGRRLLMHTRRRVRRAGDHHADPRPQRRLLGGDQLRGRRSRAGHRLRAARSLPRAAALRLGRRLAGGGAPARRAGGGAPEGADEHAGARRPVAAARALRRGVRRCLVRAHGGRPPRRPADHGLQADARHDGRADALAVRHLPRRLARPPDRAGLRDVRAQGGWQHRPHQHARRLAAGGLQLRLPGPGLQAGGRRSEGIEAPARASRRRPSAPARPAAR